MERTNAPFWSDPRPIAQGFFRTDEKAVPLVARPPVHYALANQVPCGATPEVRGT